MDTPTPPVTHLRKLRFAKYAWFVLGYNILVILWGAYVRATGSGAGCGSHWPTCNGEIIPRATEIETLIEFTHRATSGLAFLFVLGLLIWARKLYERSDPVWKASVAAMLFIISESLVGAGLVLFEWVAGNLSTGRVIVMAIHLLNTHLLIAAIALAAWWSSNSQPDFSKKPQKHLVWLYLISIIGIIILSMAGAVTALGDTLFPAESLVAGIKQDFSPTSHMLVRMRIWHPVIAIIVGIALLWTVLPTATSSKPGWVRHLSVGLISIFGLQLIAGMVNLILLAPVWMQIVHLFLADITWIFLILLTSEIFTSKPITEEKDE